MLMSWTELKRVTGCAQFLRQNLMNLWVRWEKVQDGNRYLSLKTFGDASLKDLAGLSSGISFLSYTKITKLGGED